MRIRDRVYLIGSGLLGMNSTDELDCNVYLLDGGDQQAIIDCGSGYGVGRIMEELQLNGFKSCNIKYILLTHAHMDHIGGANALQRMTGAIIGASESTSMMLERGDEEAIGLLQAKIDGVYPEDCHLTPCTVNLMLKNTMKLHIGDLTIEVIETPGHSHDSISFYCPELHTLFCGDTVFAGGKIAALTTYDFSMIQLSQSMLLLMQLNVKSLMPGHLMPVVRNGHRSIDQAVSAFTNKETLKSIV